MDFQKLLDYLVPILFIVVWALARMFNVKEDSDEYQPPPEDREEPYDPYEELLGKLIPVEEQAPVQVPKAASPHQAQAPVPQGIDYMGELAKQRERLQQIAAEAPEAVSKRKKMAVGARMESKRTRRKESGSRKALRSMLAEPKAAQKAFLLHEILGSPVGQRQNHKMGPLWD